MLLKRAVSSLTAGPTRSGGRSPSLIAGRSSPVAQPRVVAHVTKDTEQVTGVLFAENFGQVQTELAVVSKTDPGVDSFARSNFHAECEAAINEQINIEYNVSYVYHSMYAYFDRDNVALPGLATFFKNSSEEEREHAELLMAYQNKRGGRVKLRNIVLPDVELGADNEKGDALYAMELALSLEKLNFTKLRELEAVAARHNDASMSDFVEGQLLEEQVDSVKMFSEYVAQLRRVGKGLGVYLFDKQLQGQAPAA